MAQTGFTPISIYYSSTAFAVPTAGNLVAGELAINTADGRLYYKDSAGVVQTIASKAGALGDVVGPASSTDNAVSRFDTTTGKLIQNSLVTISDTGAISAPVDASISGLTIGLGASAVASNTALGVTALSANTTGNSNTVIGYAAGNDITTGSRNTIVGRDAGTLITTSSDNTAYGAFALAANTGASNTGIGSYALQANTSGNNNTALGYATLINNTTGATNIAIGALGGSYTALNLNTTGSANTAVGNGSLGQNTTASSNTAVGYQAGYSNTVATDNTFIGQKAGYSFAGTGSTYNTFVGSFSGYSQTSGTGNMYIGLQSGYSMTTGSKNTILGGYSGNQGGLDIRTANNYIVLSDGDGNPRGVFDNSGNFIVGATAAITSGIVGNFVNSNASYRNFVVYNTYAGNCGTINSLLTASANNTSSYHFVGNTGGTDRVFIYGNGNIVNTGNSYGTLSDIKLKENIVDASAKLDDVMKLKVRNFNLKSDSDLKQIGFIAQEFEQVFPSMVDETQDRDADGNNLEATTKSIKTSVLVPILVKAIQELNAKLEAQALEIATLKAK